MIRNDSLHIGKRLEEIASEKMQGPDSGYQLSGFTKVENLYSSDNKYIKLLLTVNTQNITLQQTVKVIKYDNPTTWRLIYEGNGIANAEEVVMRVQGVICQKDLPPLTNRPRYDTTTLSPSI